MYKLFALIIFLPHLLRATSTSESQTIQKPPVITHDGINIHLNVSNSHDVEKKDNVHATNQCGDPKPQVIHLIISKQEESLSTKIKNALIPAAVAGIFTQIPYGKLAEQVKEAINAKKIVNSVLKRG